jgi:hypothetical protein
LKCNIAITVKQKCNHPFLLVSRGNLVFTCERNIDSATPLLLYFQIIDREGAENPQRVQWGRLQGQQVPPRQDNPPPPPPQQARERTQLQILEHARELAEWEARDAAKAAMQHRVNIEFNSQAKFIFNWLRRSSKCS